MYGGIREDASDISTSDLDGLRKISVWDSTNSNWTTTFSLETVPVGFLEHGNKQPTSQ